MAADLMKLRNRLLNQRQEILREFLDLEGGWQALGERDIELEEEAQKMDISTLYDQIEEREKEEIEAIDLSLNKMVLGTYGSCENCGMAIKEERLQALPETRLCRRCAGRFEEQQEKLPPPAEVISRPELPPEFREMSNEEVCAAVTEFLRHDGQVNLEELEILCQHGVLYLEGVIPSEAEHQILMRILTDELGFRSFIDHLWITDVPWEREDRTPGTRKPAAPFAEGQLTEAENTTEDLFEYQEEDVPYSPPDRPPVEKE